MLKDERNLLEILKDELQFLEQGSYRKNTRDLWRPRFFLEDSPSCFNHAQEHRRPCTECALIDLVPTEFQQTRIPCRHIPLNPEGQTLDSLYRTSNEAETEGAFHAWLRSTIARLSGNQAPADILKTAEPGPDYKKGHPLFLNKLNPKCANRSCAVGFSWHHGGTFFRFRPDVADSALQSGSGPHHVKHYWLCDSCSHVFTLNHKEGQGVVLEIRTSLAMAHTSS